MTRVFSGPLSVYYHQAYLLPVPLEIPDLRACFRGQANGLCGAALPGKLFLLTGLHTGYVDFTVDILDRAPALDDMWEEAVEVPFFVARSDLALVEWAGEASYPISLPQGNYRARYCAKGMQLAWDETNPSDRDFIDSYSLTFWPAPPVADSVLTTTTEAAAYLHRRASAL
jgi:hypothetical protein